MKKNCVCTSSYHVVPSQDEESLEDLNLYSDFPTSVSLESDTINAILQVQMYTESTTIEQLGQKPSEISVVNSSPVDFVVNEVDIVKEVIECMLSEVKCNSQKKIDKETFYKKGSMEKKQKKTSPSIRQVVYKRQRKTG